jgi:lambda family phage portal protein
MWGRKGACELTGRWSWNTLQRLLIRTLVIDGELSCASIAAPSTARTDTQLQLIDIDRLWEHNNKALPDGGAIHMGVEVDPAIGRPVAYHLLKRKPAQWQMSGYGMDFERVPADEIIHIFVPDFAEQCRGVPWMYAALLNLVHIGAFEEAAVIAARVGARRWAFIQSPDGGRASQHRRRQGRPSGNPQIEAEPGTFRSCRPGTSSAAGTRSIRTPRSSRSSRRCCAAWRRASGVAYHNLAGDMEGVNYSSARMAELDERDAWMGCRPSVEHLHQPIYDDWLRMSVVAGALPFDLARLDKYRAVKWQPRRWAWVDPQNEGSRRGDRGHQREDQEPHRVITAAAPGGGTTSADGAGEDIEIERVFDGLAEISRRAPSPPR